MSSGTISERLVWWRENGGGAEPAALNALLVELRAWRDEHDQDRARMPGPFFKMVWDGIFGDEHEAVETAIGEVEAALAAQG